MRTRAVIATCFKNPQFNLTLEHLQQLAETAANKPILIDFDETKKTGIVLSAKVVDGQLIADLDLDLSATRDPLFCVPGFKTKLNRAIDQAVQIDASAESSKERITMINCGITREPNQKDLTPIYSPTFES